MVATKNRKKFDRSKGLLFIVIGILILVIVALIAMYPHPKTTASVDDAVSGVHVSLGPLTIRIVNNKAVKRTDASAAGLTSFLEAMGQKDVSNPTHCPSTYYNVIAANKDETQVLLDYGCYSPGARMFAIKQEGTWKTLSPTNQFDLFGVPNCDYVNSNKIDKAVAPVCQSGFDKLTYSVRD